MQTFIRSYPPLLTRTARLTLSLVAGLLAANAAAGDNEQLSAKDAYDQLHSVERQTFSLSESSQNTAIRDEYSKFFGKAYFAEDLQNRITNEDLGYFFQAAYLTFFYTSNPKLLTQLHVISDEMEKRGRIDNQQRGMLYESMIRARRFDDARLYLDQHPELNFPPPPTVETRSSAKLALYSVEADNRLKEIEAPLDGRPMLVVVSHPQCGFSRAAMEAAAKDPIVSRSLERVLWITPQDANLYLKEIQAWNQAHPTTRVFVTKFKSDWPMLDQWATPNFYLLVDGVVKQHFSGWPRDGKNMEKLRELSQMLLHET